MLKGIGHIDLFKNKTVAGINVFILPDSGYKISLIRLKQNKSKVHIEYSKTGLTSPEEIVKHIPKHSPVCLSVDGKGIMHKKMDISAADHKQSFLHLILPNAPADDFFLQKTEVSERELFLSVIRYDIINKLLSELEANGLFVIRLTLGPFDINQVIPLLNEPGERIATETAELILSGGKIHDIRKKELPHSQTTYLIGEEKIPGELLAPYAGCLHYFLGQEKTEDEAPQVIKQREEYAGKRIFTIAGWSVLLFFFILLLVNFFLFDRYSKKNNELYERLSQNKDILARLDILSKELKQKETFIAKSGLLRSSRQSYFADRIASSVPENISLTKLNIQPLKKKLAEGELPEFVVNTILIAGLTRQSTLLNDWIKIIKKEHWTRDVKIKNYNQEGSGKSGEFEIEVIVK